MPVKPAKQHQNVTKRWLKCVQNVADTKGSSENTLPKCEKEHQQKAYAVNLYVRQGQMYYWSQNK
jgi:hypothetical protein